MKAPQALAMIAANVFIVSLFPTAFHNSSSHVNRGNPLTGMDCFLISLIALVDDGSLAAFGVANLTFFPLVGMLLGSWPRFLKTRLVVSLLACGAAFSWFLFGLRHLGDLGPAYYLWLGAYIVLLLGHVSAVRKSRH